MQALQKKHVLIWSSWHLHTLHERQHRARGLGQLYCVCRGEVLFFRTVLLLCRWTVRIVCWPRSLFSVPRRFVQVGCGFATTPNSVCHLIVDVSPLLPPNHRYLSRFYWPKEVLAVRCGVLPVKSRPNDVCCMSARLFLPPRVQQHWHDQSKAMFTWHLRWYREADFLPEMPGGHLLQCRRRRMLPMWPRDQQCPHGSVCLQGL